MKRRTVVPDRGPGRGPGRIGKTAAALRTIGEVAAEIGVPTHVLRFWESRFVEIQPVKCRGGRRYYRPEDVILLDRIKTLLYGQGYTIKGVQRLLANKAGVPSAPPVDEATAEEGEIERLRRALSVAIDELTAIRALLLGDHR